MKRNEQNFNCNYILFLDNHVAFFRIQKFIFLITFEKLFE